MNDQRNHPMRESLLEDVRTEIEMAREGQIPPSWQYDRLEDLKQAVAKHWISEQEYSDLCAQFEAAVRSTRQITDRNMTARSWRIRPATRFSAGTAKATPSSQSTGTGTDLR